MYLLYEHLTVLITPISGIEETPVAMTISVSRNTVSRHFEDFVFTVLNSLTRVLFTRESEQNPGGFALSIKDWEQVRWPFSGIGGF